MPNIFLAIQSRNLKAVQETLRDSDCLESKYENGSTPLHMAALAGFGEIVSEILSHRPNLESRNEEEQTALMGACALGQSGIVAQLLRAGALPDGTGPFPKETALMMAAITSAPDCLRLVLEAGANVNGKNDAGATALMTAIHWNHVESVKLLIQGGASVDLQDRRGRTALFHAVAADRDAVCSYLLGVGANPDIADNDGVSPRILAAESANIRVRAYFDRPVRDR